MSAATSTHSIRGRLAAQVKVPGAEGWFRTWLPMLCLVVIVVGGVIAATVGTLLLVDFINAKTGTPPGKPVDIGVRGALVVAWIAFVAFAFTCANLVVPSLRRKPLVFVVPETAYSWLAGLTAVSAGLLIGISIFT